MQKLERSKHDTGGKYTSESKVLIKVVGFYLCLFNVSRCKNTRISRFLPPFFACLCWQWGNRRCGHILCHVKLYSCFYCWAAAVICCNKISWPQSCLRHTYISHLGTPRCLICKSHCSVLTLFCHHLPNPPCLYDLIRQQRLMSQLSICHSKSCGNCWSVNFNKLRNIKQQVWPSRQPPPLWAILVIKEMATFIKVINTRIRRNHGTHCLWNHVLSFTGFDV